MLDLQRVKRNTEGPSSIGSLHTISFNRFDNALGSICATLQPRDVWGDGGPENEGTENDWHEAGRENEAMPQDSSANPSRAMAILASHESHPESSPSTTGFMETVQEVEEVSI